MHSNLCVQIPELDVRTLSRLYSNASCFDPSLEIVTNVIQFGSQAEYVRYFLCLVSTRHSELLADRIGKIKL